MSGISGGPRLDQIAERFAAHGVEYVVIGGQAEWLMGSPRMTFDTDLCYRRTPENIQRLAAALVDFRPRLRGAPAGLPFKADAKTIQAGMNFTFDTTVGDLDLLGYVEPLGEYDAVSRRASDVALPGGLVVRVIDLDDLITIKRHIKREKDKDSLLQLLAIKRVREEEGRV